MAIDGEEAFTELPLGEQDRITDDTLTASQRTPDQVREAPARWSRIGTLVKG